ncbi:MAG TPA: hypothetical protein VJR92_10990 [Gemmatimonadaceae bacterium]|nr:hypothetical protein [Gemmatimonadaceae bacterium]
MLVFPAPVVVRCLRERRVFDISLAVDHFSVVAQNFSLENMRRVTLARSDSEAEIIGDNERPKPTSLACGRLSVVPRVTTLGVAFFKAGLAHHPLRRKPPELA